MAPHREDTRIYTDTQDVMQISNVTGPQGHESDNPERFRNTGHQIGEVAVGIDRVLAIDTEQPCNTALLLSQFEKSPFSARIRTVSMYCCAKSILVPDKRSCWTGNARMELWKAQTDW